MCKPCWYVPLFVVVRADDESEAVDVADKLMGAMCDMRPKELDGYGYVFGPAANPAGSPAPPDWEIREQSIHIVDGGAIEIRTED